MSQIGSIIEGTKTELKRVQGSPEAEAAVVRMMHCMMGAHEWSSGDIIYVVDALISFANNNRFNGSLALLELYSIKKSEEI